MRRRHQSGRSDGPRSSRSSSLCALPSEASSTSLPLQYPMQEGQSEVMPNGANGFENGDDKTWSLSPQQRSHSVGSDLYELHDLYDGLSDEHLRDQSSLNLKSLTQQKKQTVNKKNAKKRMAMHSHGKNDVISFVAEKITKGDYWGFIPSTQVFEDVEVFVDSIQRQLVIEIDETQQHMWEEVDGQNVDKSQVVTGSGISNGSDALGKSETAKRDDAPLVQRVAKKLKQKIVKASASPPRRKQSFFDTYRSDDDEEEGEEETPNDNVDTANETTASAAGVNNISMNIDTSRKVFYVSTNRERHNAASPIDDSSDESPDVAHSRRKDHDFFAKEVAAGIDPITSSTNPAEAHHRTLQNQVSFSKALPTPSPRMERRPVKRLVIKWDSITGLDFQYSPCAPVTVVIEVSHVPAECPEELRSVVFFLYCSKEQVGIFFDGQMIARDKRLYQLSMKSLPTWAVIINKYGLPLYYSYRFRVFITTLVNFYIIISLLWGFYDLYKNLPFIGSALRSVFDPVIRFFAPIMNNTVILLVPLVWNQFVSVFRKFFGLFASCFGDIPIFRMLSEMHSTMALIFSQIMNFVQPLIDMMTVFKNVVVSVVTFGGTILWTLLQVPIAIMKVFGTSLATVFQQLRLIISTLWSGGIGLIVMVYEVFYGFFYSIYMVFYLFYRMIVFPFQKLKWIFTLGTHVDVQKAQETIHAAQRIGSATASNTDRIRSMMTRLQETLTPFQRVWGGFRRIVDSIIHTYHARIKYRSKNKQRILIASLLLAVLLATIIVFLLVL